MAAYEHAYLWQKGKDERENNYTLAEESVMTGTGPVFFGVICDSDFRAKQMVGWFYDEVLPLVREHGLGAFVRNGFLRHFSGQKEQYSYGVVIVYGRRMFFALRGNLEFVRISGRGRVRIISERKEKRGLVLGMADSTMEKRSCGFAHLHRKETILLCNNNFADCFNFSELSTVFVGKKKVKIPDETKLQMLGRRAIGRGCRGSIAAITFSKK